MNVLGISTLCFLPLLYFASCASLDVQPKNDRTLVGEIDTMPNSAQTDHEEPEKRNWNNLSGMWGKRGWNNLSGAWGKRNNWNNLSGMWGKRNNWNNLSGMWGKRDWNNLSGMWGKKNNWNNLSGAWGKRGWNNLSGAWGKRNNWNNLSGMWGKRVLDEATLADESKKSTKWNNLRGMWGKRGDKDWAIQEMWEQRNGMDDESDEPVFQDQY